MKKIFLITYKNSIYRDSLISVGFEVEDISQPLSGDLKPGRVIEGCDGGCTAVVEISDDNIEAVSPLVSELKDISAKIVFITARLTNRIRTYLFETGIPDILETDDAARLIDYLLIVNNNDAHSIGRIIVLEDVESHVSIFETIISRFRHRAIFVGNEQDLFESIKQDNIQFTLVNLGAKGFDINSFVKKAFSRPEVKRVPLIPYKKDEDGLMVNEIISGINRMAGVILTADELFSFLVNILFRLEIYQAINILNRSVDFKGMENFFQGSLREAYNGFGRDIFSINSIVKGDCFNKLGCDIEAVKKVLTKIDGLKWMIIDRLNAATCGPGV